MNRKKLITAGVVCAAVVAAAAGLFFGRSGGKGAGGGMPGGPGGMMAKNENVTVVKAGAPTVGDLSLTTGLTGTVEAADVFYVYAKASGDVTDVYVKAGDRVEAGQVLCEIDTEQVEGAKNSLDSAEVSMSQAKSNLNRMQILYNGGDLSDQEYEQYVNQAKSAQLQYESAKLNYERQVGYSTITSPIAGTVESCDVEVYDRVSANNQLCVISGEGDSRITFYVTQRMLKNMRVGDELEVVKSGTSYKGWITEINNMVDSESGLFKVKAVLEDTDQISIGSTVKLNVTTVRAEHAMLVPVDAIYYSNSKAYVYLYEDGYAKMRQVEVGIYDSEYAEILSGLTADDLVISTWSSNLYEGAEVRLRDEEAQGEGEAPHPQAP